MSVTDMCQNIRNQIFKHDLSELLFLSKKSETFSNKISFHFVYLKNISYFSVKKEFDAKKIRSHFNYCEIAILESAFGY